MLLVLGLWGGLVPLIGPYFGYAFGSHATWDLTMNRFWLDVLPGGFVAIGGLMLIWSGHRVSGTVATWMAMAGGAWFAVGPAVSRLWEHGPGPIGVPLFGHTRQTFELIGYFYGLGALIMGLAAFALGRVVTKQAMVVEPAPMMGDPAMNDQRMTNQPMTNEPMTNEPMTAGYQPMTNEPMTAAGQPMTAGGEPAVDDRSQPEPITRRRPITGGSDQDAAVTGQTEQEAPTTESQQVPAHR